MTQVIMMSFYGDDSSQDSRLIKSQDKTHRLFFFRLVLAIFFHIFTVSDASARVSRPAVSSGLLQNIVPSGSGQGGVPLEHTPQTFN